MTDELYDKEFNHLIDRYLDTGTMSSEAYEGLTPNQKAVVQVIKRSFERYSRRNAEIRS